MSSTSLKHWGFTAAAFAMLAVAFLAYCVFASHRGEQRARTACASLHVGQKADEAERALIAPHAVRMVGHPRHDMLTFMYHGAPHERWACVASLEEGKVSAIEVRHLD